MQARQRIGLDELHASRLVAAQVDAPRVATAQRRPDVERHPHRRDTRLILGQPILHSTFVVLLVGVRIHLGLGLCSQQHLHRSQRLSLAAAAEDADGELAARQEALDQHRLQVAMEQVLAGRAQLRTVSHFRRGGDALTRTFGNRFDKQGIRQRHARKILQALDDFEIRCADAVVAKIALGRTLVQRKRQHERIGQGVWDPVRLQQRRHLGFATVAVQPLGEIEHQVPAVALHQARGQRT